MKTPPLRFMLLLAGATLLQCALCPAATESPPAKSGKKVSGARIFYPDKTVEQVAAAWQRMFGDAVTVSDRAKMRRVTLELAAPSKEELRKMMVDALRVQGVNVLTQPNGVLFDLDPAVKPAK